MPDTALTSLGRYTLQAELGHGGFATVYRATDTALEREVALKVLKPGWTDDVRAVERFMREAKQVSRLKHPNIVTIYDVGQSEGRLFIAMELVPGGTGSRFDWDWACRAKEEGRPIILAGGLRPSTVARVIGMLRPWAVDVSSGVEEVKGRKSADRIRAFCRAVRLADKNNDHVPSA